MKSRSILNEAIELIGNIFRVCQDTEERNAARDQRAEAKRLDGIIQDINDCCDDFLADSIVKAMMEENK